MKFSNIEAECAHAIVGHGFAESEFGTVEDPGGWNGLVTVSAVLLLNVGEEELAQKFALEYLTKPARAQEIVVWLTEDDQGFVSLRGVACSDEADWICNTFEDSERLAEAS